MAAAGEVGGRESRFEGALSAPGCFAITAATTAQALGPVCRGRATRTLRAVPQPVTARSQTFGWRQHVLKRSKLPLGKTVHAQSVAHPCPAPLAHVVASGRGNPGTVSSFSSARYAIPIELTRRA